MNYAEAAAYARDMQLTDDGRAFLTYIVERICGVGGSIHGRDDTEHFKAVGAHNVGVEILELTKERKAEK